MKSGTELYNDIAGSHGQRQGYYYDPLLFVAPAIYVFSSVML